MWRPTYGSRRLHHWHEWRPGQFMSACGLEYSERFLGAEDESYPKCKRCVKAIAMQEAEA